MVAEAAALWSFCQAAWDLPASYTTTTCCTNAAAICCLPANDSGL